MSSIDTALADNILQIRGDLDKVARPVQRREGAYYSLLQQLEHVAKILQGNVVITPPATPAPTPAKPVRKVTGKVIYVDFRGLGRSR